LDGGRITRQAVGVCGGKGGAAVDSFNARTVPRLRRNLSEYLPTWNSPLALLSV
jgi:hypothetical protein